VSQLARIAGIAAVGLALAGCGGTPAREHSAARTREVTSSGPFSTTISSGHTSVVQFQRVGVKAVGSVVMWGNDGTPGRPVPVRDLYEVFRRDPGESDTQAQRIARADGYGDRFSGPVGKPLYPDTRLVSGSTARGVYALPTSKQFICIGAFPRGGGGCLTPGQHGLTIDFDTRGDGSASLYGLIGDDVQGIDAVVGGKTFRARLGENAYALSTNRQPTKLVVHLRNGETDEIELP
jgi:hypothetical protein